MLFNSNEFLLFALIVFGLYLVSAHRSQNRLLLVASYVFYGSWDWRFLSLIVLSTVVDYFCALQIAARSSARARKGFLMLSLVLNLGVLGVFKYFNFFADSLAELAAEFGIALGPIALNVILPVGISFYTFQTLSYTIDVYKREIPAERSFWDFALFVSFFPQLVAGPIERAKNLLPQVTSARSISREDVIEGGWLIFYGYFLKVFVADNLAQIADNVFSMEAPPAGSEALLGIYAFAFQILGDFAGYSSIAIGVARLLGFRLMTNFLYPYFVTNPSDFWRNWHISLSTWLRDYLYIPLGGNRGGRLRTYRNLMLTMLLGGLWHGAAWTFVLWGLYQGAILAVHRAWVQLFGERGKRRMFEAASIGLKIVVMFHVTCFGWLIFRAGSVGQVTEMTQSIISGVMPTPTAVYYASELLFYTWLLLGINLLQVWRKDVYAVLKMPLAVRVVIMAGMAFSVLAFGEFHGQEFIYFQF